MKVGAEPKKIAILGALVVIGGYVAYTNVINPGDDIPESAQRIAEPPALVPQIPVPEVRRQQPDARRMVGRAQQEYKPTMRRRPEDRIDPLQVDPTLRTDLLAKLEAVKIEGAGERSLFDFGQAPAVKLAAAKPEPKIIPKPIGPEPPPPPPVKQPPPPPPPIPLKFYGFTNLSRAPQKRAFFLDGDEIVVAGEGDVIRKRFRVVRIGVNSAVVEDMEHKHQQTLPLVEDQSS